jgi:hypothetical protein
MNTDDSGSTAICRSNPGRKKAQKGGLVFVTFVTFRGPADWRKLRGCESIRGTASPQSQKMSAGCRRVSRVHRPSDTLKFRGRFQHLRHGRDRAGRVGVRPSKLQLGREIRFHFVVAGSFQRCLTIMPLLRDGSRDSDFLGLRLDPLFRIEATVDAHDSALSSGRRLPSTGRK